MIGDLTKVVGSDERDAQSDHYRYERKFSVMALERREIELILQLNSAAFSAIYQPRWVNSIYLDTLDSICLSENLNGASQNRVKIRIRWYGDFEGSVSQPTLELKIRQGQVNRKILFSLSPLNVDRTLSIHTVRGLIRKADIPPNLMQEILKFELAVTNRYHRSYFLSADKAFRVTIDSSLKFRRLKSVGNGFAGNWIDDMGRVLELKYDRDSEGRAHQISQQFPFRSTRNSKFVSGLELTGGHLGYL